MCTNHRVTNDDVARYKAYPSGAANMAMRMVDVALAVLSLTGAIGLTIHKPKQLLFHMHIDCDPHDDFDYGWIFVGLVMLLWTVPRCVIGFSLIGQERCDLSVIKLFFMLVVGWSVASLFWAFGLS